MEGLEDRRKEGWTDLNHRALHVMASRSPKKTLNK